MSSGKWTAADLPSQTGRTVLITGANSGIGLVAARELAGVGAKVILAVRDPAKGERASTTIAGETEVRRLDLADLASVRELAEGWEGDLDVLVNNAGVMAPPERRTKDGFELQIGTNHLGHFALTNLLLPRITDRVVTVSSHRQDQPGRPQLGAPRLPALARLRSIEAREPAVHARASAAPCRGRLRGPRRRGPPRLFGDESPGAHRERPPERGDGDRQQADGAKRRDGRVADPVRGDPGHPGRQLRRPRRLHG